MKRAVAKAKSRTRAARSPRPVSFPVVGVGSSAGGLEAFSELLHHLPEKTGIALVLVQHLDPKHSSDLREILGRTTAIPVHDVTDGVAIRPDHIYVIPPNTTMTLKNGALRLSPRALARGQHLPIDHFLFSLAEQLGSRAIGVILSGTGSDGTAGSRAIKAAGGITFAQDERSAKYGGMPHSAVYSGYIDFVLSPSAIAGELARAARHPYLKRHLVGNIDLDPLAGDQMDVLLSLLRESTGVDFAHYKQTTLRRRINRRMVLHKIEKLKDYVQFCRHNSVEIEDLYHDVLIHVTGFFRDPESFEALRKNVFPKLFRDHANGGTVRVWVPGCSSGEEVYSLAMAMLEYLWLETTKTGKPALGSTPFQIFATDISDASLDRARAGIYSQALVADISPERLRRFFVALDGGYQIAKPVREMCIFARQNVAKDPPFSNLDLVSCRNLLIYLGPVLQKRVVPALHYALKPTGYLMLGGAESLGTFSEYFMPVDKKNKIYRKKPGPGLATYFGAVDFGIRRPNDPKAPREARPVFAIEKEVDRMLIERFAPASIVVNDQMEIVQFRGKTGAYLEPAAGQPTFSLSKMAREGLLIDLRAALSKAKKENVTVQKAGVRVHSDGQTREVELEVSPLRGAERGERFYVIVFQERPAAGAKAGPEATARGAKDGSSRENARLKHELAQIRAQFQVLIQEHDTTSEQFKSANEEVLSANEELQSTNEELETAKEELQSTNEELTTLNEELQNRNAELNAVNNDLLNLLGNVTVPVVIVGHDLHIRRFTTPAQTLLNLLPGDVGRRLSEIRPNLDVDDLGRIAAESIVSVSMVERQVREKETGAWHLMRVRPYKTWDNKIDGAVISFQDIDVMKRDLDRMYQHADALIENARESILVLNGKLEVMSANRAFYREFEASREETLNHPIYELFDGQWNIPKLRELLESILPNDGQVEDFEVRHDFPRLGTRRMMLNAGRIEPRAGQNMILLYIEDTT